MKNFCNSHAWSWSLSEGKTSFCAVYKKILQILIYVFSFSFFFLIQSPSLSSSVSHLRFDGIWSNIDKVLLINPPANVFVFMSIVTTGWPILVELVDLVNSVIIFISQITFLRWSLFLLGSLTVTFTVLLFWIYLFLLMLVFVLWWLSWENCCLNFHQIQKGMPCFIA